MPLQQQAERRVQQRWNLIVPLAVYNRADGALIGHVVNVSLRGMLLVGDQPLPIGERFSVELELPGDEGQWDRTPVVANSVRSFTDPDDDSIINTGFQFEEVSPQALFSLQRLIEDITSFS